MMDDEYLLVVLAAMDDEDYRFRSMRSGSAVAVTPEPEPPTELNAFQTDAFENDAFE